MNFPERKEKRADDARGPSRSARVALVAVTLLASSALAAGVDFAPRVDFLLELPGCTAGVDCSESPLALVSGDFDGDGRSDAATANDASDDVTILLGDGTGSLEAAVSVGAGERPAAIRSPTSWWRTTSETP